MANAGLTSVFFLYRKHLYCCSRCSRYNYWQIVAPPGEQQQKIVKPAVADAGGSLGYITMTTLHYIENYLQSQIALDKNYW